MRRIREDRIDIYRLEIRTILQTHQNDGNKTLEITPENELNPA